MWLISYVTCVDIIAQVSLTPRSILLFLDVSTLEFWIIIIIIILPIDQPKIILLTARKMKKLSCLHLK